MATFTVNLPDGGVWTPKFVDHIEQEKCIGCGRCFKVCGRDVLAMAGMTEDGELVALAADDDDEDEYDKKVMTIANRSNCVGCEACAKICPKKCYTHQPLVTG